MITRRGVGTVFSVPVLNSDLKVYAFYSLSNTRYNFIHLNRFMAMKFLLCLIGNHNVPQYPQDTDRQQNKENIRQNNSEQIPSEAYEFSFKNSFIYFSPLVSHGYFPLSRYILLLAFLPVRRQYALRYRRAKKHFNKCCLT